MSGLMMLPTWALMGLVFPLSSAAYLPLYVFLATPLALHRRWPFKLAGAVALYYAAFSLVVAVEVSGSSQPGVAWLLFGGPFLVLAVIGGGVWAWQARRHGLAEEQAHAQAVRVRWAWRLGLSQVEPPPVEGGSFAAALARRWTAYRSTPIQLPDGSIGTVVINSRAEQLKIAIRLVQLVALVVGIIFAQSIWEWMGERAAGNSTAIARGVLREFGRQLGF